ncbi:MULTISPECIES: tetrahydrofolate dehydrogenase/cyclohydrolase catalytic domain-containing protein [unclassified Novosphingobium]|uniref:bifunctional 5,10-methylenetetrahydrofolate dehydrogenase/5,10-methenyltetrahydrofolate cyclohydrolase n=1 Tax=unclassified Novosphingobium TaxID=2644732 RepID=UPI000EED14CD|nr:MULTISPECIES: tetrahydrofolate dehydrogenase/cyclohydrolase catalytic domain-containing protein [unclassified Novosphingobium]HCF24790.1 bifunctional methylenetetrahydrofolate dehydrogenase/methenyltetrahydrofolate cyclohydrolase [Novosphingobium sp.]HQV01999.1 tetrahydrofolate dehydrogenase/cyclohydrolase catalytic domain-containing protein [Novosphingobium sp.]
MHAEIIDGRKLAREVTDAVAAQVRGLPRPPGLAVIIVGDDPASHLYVRNKVRTAEKVGFKSETIRLPADTGEADVLARINWLNMREDIDGILVQLPLPPQLNTLRVMAAVDPGKDVDGLHALNAGKLTQGSQALIPCTPMGCLKIIKSVIPDLTGCHAVVIGASNIVGKPMAALLLEENATVTHAHIHTRDTQFICRGADILVSAVGKPGLVRGDWIKPRAVVIDVGTSRVEQPDGTVLTKGDVEFDEAVNVAGAITPVPGGVGPMTIACLMENTLIAARARMA